MKRLILLLSSTVLLFSCNKTENKTDINTVEGNLTDSIQVSNSFSIEEIPFITTEIGDFPFFSLPENIEEMNKPLVRDFDLIYFSIKDQYIPIEGKVYKANIRGTREVPFSQHYFIKSFDDYLKSIGAVKVFDGKLTNDNYNTRKDNDPNIGDEGDIGYGNEAVKCYVLRTKDKGNIYVQFTADNATGKLNILQEGKLNQTIKKITADDIVKDLNEKGKSILYINFDVDKSNVSMDGKELISQISEALKKDNSLKISIEGHTDNSGDGNHNKKLSNDRANSVMNDLIQSGIDKNRLSAKGFGAENPLVANDSEENKAKNRRVELIKL
ncbi:OmpA family protein [Faecalibacter macacae]|uniref:OmpA family protein n=1 Tax=Faecalibacter macacae TaxID=1859289 RepID=A0A3L9MCW3_9FLAO|nr:OmpA family protein [Faecalibacter macacae]RLZ09104.1 OmpA family protein [Faecalibacter macacae]